MRLFVLRTPFDPSNERSRLNGHIVGIHYNRNSEGLDILDFTSFKKLSDLSISWKTTKVVNVVNTDDGIKFTTKSGAVYDFVDVATLIPPYPAETPAPHVIVKAVVVHGGFGDPSTFTAVYDDGKEEVIFDFFRDELFIDPHDFIGKTYDEAMKLFEELNTAYLC